MLHVFPPLFFFLILVSYKERLRGLWPSVTANSSALVSNQVPIFCLACACFLFHATHLNSSRLRGTPFILTHFARNVKGGLHQERPSIFSKISFLGAKAGEGGEGVEVFFLFSFYWQKSFAESFGFRLQNLKRVHVWCISKEGGVMPNRWAGVKINTLLQ